MCQEPWRGTIRSGTTEFCSVHRTKIRRDIDAEWTNSTSCFAFVRIAELDRSLKGAHALELLRATVSAAIRQLESDADT